MRRLPKTLAALFAVVCMTAAAAAQGTPQSQIDKEIEATQRRLNELKQQKRRDELLKQRRAIDDELNRMGGGSPTDPAPAETPAPSTSSADDVERPARPRGGSAASGPNNSSDSPVGAAAGGATAGGGAGGAVGGGSGSGGGQAGAAASDDKCLQAANGLVNLNTFDEAVCALARDVVLDPSFRIDPTSEEAFLVNAWFGQMAKNAAVDAALKEFVLGAESTRTDKQIGADPKSSGTTSLAVKGGIPSVLGWATEHGAAVASRDGTAVTFRFNPVGAVEALSGAGYISSFRRTEDDPLVKFFRSTSVGVTFDTSRGTDPPTLIGSKQQVSAVSFRYQFINQRDPRNRSHRRDWEQFIKSAGLQLTSAQADALMKLEIPATAELKLRNPALQKWLDDTNAAIAARESELKAMKAVPVTGEAAARNAVRQIIERQLDSLPVSKLSEDPVLVNAMTSFVTALQGYTTKKNELLDEINKGTVVSFEYTNHREVDAPDLSNFRFIAERGTVGGLDFTGNASVTIFNKRPADPDSKRVKDFSFALQLDKRLKNTMGLGDSTLSFAGKFERAESNAVALDGTVLPNTKGDIAAGQIKLTIPLGQTGIKLPFSVTFANRTELVREREVRGNFGFTLDFDSLFARFKPF